MYYSSKRITRQPLGFLLLWLFYNILAGLSELFIHIELDQLSLDLGDQIAVVLVNYKSHRTTTPLGSLVEVCEPLTMIFVLSIKHYPWSTV
jgi:hypothetical protein